MTTYQAFIEDLKAMKEKNKGLMSEAQYTNVGYIMSAIAPCNLLVFGLGDDSFLWDKLNHGGKTVFLEDDKEWIENFKNSNLSITPVEYTTFVGDHEKIKFDSLQLEMNLPDTITSKKWDMIIVDAPLGHGPPGRPYKGPGRMQSIYTAHKLLKDGGICVIDDMKRLVEQKYGIHYFGYENILNVIENKVGIFKKKINKSLRSLISGKKIALVGPAQYMENSNLGKEIDEHDIVVRINRGIESIDIYSKDIGAKTDVYYSCLIERAQQTGVLNIDDLKNKYKIKHIVAPPESNMKGISFETKFHSLVDKEKIKNINDIIPVTIVDHQFHTLLAEKVKCKPNTGFMAIYDLLRMNPSSLSIYGFSFYLDGFLPGQKSGVEQEKNCSEQEFADMAFNSKRHIQKNMWEYAKTTLLKNKNVILDNNLERILKLDDLDRKLYKRI
jgi:hypothetical protein